VTIKNINIDKLESVKRIGENLVARCPACAEQNSDKNKHNHLCIYPDSGFSCVISNDAEHRNRILELVGEDSTDVPAIIKPPKITIPKVYPSECLNRLLPHYKYWEDRGISRETLKKLKGGYATGNEFCGYYVFPIFNLKNEIIGFTGRNTLPNNKIKWRHKGVKSSWCFPAHFNKGLIQEKREVIIVESIGNLLSLMECGIDNVMPIFGTVISNQMVNYLVSLNVNRIIISLDNDENKAGEIGAAKSSKKLDKYFDNIIIAPISGANDFNELLLTKDGKDLILNWYQNLSP
jgi:hypothetical protein